MHHLLILLLTCLGLGCWAADAPVPRTGAGDLAGYTEDLREDGTTRRGVAWPNPRFTDNANGTVTDNLTGLIWLTNANAGGAKTWDAARTYCASLAHGTAGLSDDSTAGQWRLPSVRELRSLISLQYSVPALPNAAGTDKWTAGNPFSSVQSNDYWSSTSSAGNTGNAWIVNFGDGDVYAYAKTGTGYVWPVRGGP
jgi:hypothetical protein